MDSWEGLGGHPASADGLSSQAMEPQASPPEASIPDAPLKPCPFCGARATANYSDGPRILIEHRDGCFVNTNDDGDFITVWQERVI